MDTIRARPVREGPISSRDQDAYLRKLHPQQPEFEKLRQKLIDNRDDVFVWRDLVTVRADLPIELQLEPARLGDYDRDEVLRLFREYEFRSLVERLPGMTGEEGRAPGDLLREADKYAPIPAVVVAGRQSASERAQSAPSAGGRRRSRPTGSRRSPRRASSWSPERTSTPTSSSPRPGSTCSRWAGCR